MKSLDHPPLGTNFELRFTLHHNRAGGRRPKGDRFILGAIDTFNVHFNISESSRGPNNRITGSHLSRFEQSFNIIATFHIEGLLSVSKTGQGEHTDGKKKRFHIDVLLSTSRNLLIKPRTRCFKLAKWTRPQVLRGKRSCRTRGLVHYLNHLA